jgi:hypothetical protein
MNNPDQIKLFWRNTIWREIAAATNKTQNRSHNRFVEPKQPFPLFAWLAIASWFALLAWVQ